MPSDHSSAGAQDRGSGLDLADTYHRRFSTSLEYRNRVWSVLTREFFSPYTSRAPSVLDLGCGYGHFINNIQASSRFAMDLNPDSREYLSPDVVFLEQDCSATWPMADRTLDLIFTSNFLEHLPSKGAVSATLAEAYRCLRPGGRFIAMGPNVKYVKGAYWDFFDHHVALTELSLREALELVGFRAERVTARFLPYTMVNQPQYPLALLSLYLRLPFLWSWFGGQFLVIAAK